MKKTSVFVIVFALFSGYSFGQTSQLREKIMQVIAGKKATVGVGIYSFDNGDTLSVNNAVHYPMQSTFKFHIALVVLNQIDKGRFTLQQSIPVKKSELLPKTWSPLRDKYPDGHKGLALSELLQFMVAQSDNNACDILLRLVGGPAVVNNYVHQLGVKAVQIKVNEEEAHKAWDIQYQNYTSPMAATDLLRKFYKGNILSKESYAFLWGIMANSVPGAKRLKGELPAGIVVAHKTGTSGDDGHGLYAATNDIGIVVLPNGKQFAISVYVKDSREDEVTNDKMIADVAKAAWDYFLAL